MDLKFGLTMALLGMGVTFFTLLFLILIVRLMNRLFPYKPYEKEAEPEKKVR